MGEKAATSREMAVSELTLPVDMARRVRKKAMAALEDSDLSDVLDVMGVYEDAGATSAAFKAVLAERMTDYAIKAMREARRRRSRIGAAAVIIAAAGNR